MNIISSEIRSMRRPLLLQGGRADHFGSELLQAHAQVHRDNKVIMGCKI